MGKTPQFNKALNEILNNLSPHIKQCLQCQDNFDIFVEDIEMYKKLQVPPPKLCPDCRMQRRFGFYNNILKFHKKDCLIHPDEKAITTFHSQSPYKVFDLNYWWSDKWGAEEYALDFPLLNKEGLGEVKGGEGDFSFFEFFKDFSLSVPQIPLTHYGKNVINCPYSISVINSKECYFASVGGYMENTHYSYWTGASKDSLDNLNSLNLENCYEIIYGDKLFNCRFCIHSDNCIDCAFMYGCKNCLNCFGCTNLRNKQFCFFNEQSSKEDYLKKISEIDLGNRDVLEEYKNKFKEISKNTIRRNLKNDLKNTNSSGDYLEKSKNCYMSFRVGGWGSSENIRYGQDVADCKDSMDVYIVGPNLSLGYELAEAYDASNVKFSYFIRDSINLDYCLASHNCQNCFGCIGLRNKKFHIFNKPYSEDEYWEKLDEIKTKMLTAGEYGEFFPLSNALHAYNETYASIEFPLSDEEIKKRGWVWFEEEKEADLSSMDVLRKEDVPKDIKDVTDDILQKVIICEKTGKPFRIIKFELEFYRKNNLSIPTVHPLERILSRLRERNPAKLWKSVCAKCNNEMFTSYTPEKQKELIIYCEQCYIREVV